MEDLWLYHSTQRHFSQAGLWGIRANNLKRIDD